MSRIPHSLYHQKRQQTVPSVDFQSALFYPTFHDTIHTSFIPRHYEPGYAYPLIVWLHGQGSDERQLQSIMPKVSIQNYVAVAPQGVCMEMEGFNKKEVLGWPQDNDKISQIEQHIFDAIEIAAQKYHINRRKIFLAGFDCGGTMAYRVALSHPQHFAGVLSLCGAFPTGHRPFGNLPLARKVPIFMAVGRNSRQYPDNEVCDHLRLMHTAGMSVTLRQYPCGHRLTDQMLADIDRWIIDQVTSAKSVRESSSKSWPCEAE
jgi:phospholipase/carboxylesterase